MSSTAKLWGNRHIAYTGRSAGWSISYGEGCGNIWPNHICIYLGPSHSTSRKLLEIKEHSHKVIHCWVALLKIDHDSQHTHNKIN